jgi:hypothetical protein
VKNIRVAAGHVTGNAIVVDLALNANFVGESAIIVTLHARRPIVSHVDFPNGIGVGIMASCASHFRRLIALTQLHLFHMPDDAHWFVRLFQHIVRPKIGKKLSRAKIRQVSRSQYDRRVTSQMALGTNTFRCWSVESPWIDNRQVVAVPCLIFRLTSFDMKCAWAVTAFATNGQLVQSYLKSSFIGLLNSTGVTGDAANIGYSPKPHRL